MNFDLALFARKLIKRREELGITLDELSKRSGIDNSQLMLYENGTNEPTGDDILIISKVLIVKFNFFISNEQDTLYDKTDIMYRTHSDIFNFEDRKNIEEFILLCENEQKILEILKIPLDNKFKFKINKSYKYEIIAKNSAEGFRKFLKIKPNQIEVDFYKILREKGVHLFRRKLVNSNISGLYMLHPVAGHCILLNYNDDFYRQNFSLGHELGHLVLDSTDLNFSLTSDITSPKTEIEKRANEFSAQFLFPYEMRSNLSKYNNKWDNELIMKYCNELRISSKVFCYSMRKSGFFKKSQVDTYENIRIPKNDNKDFELAHSSSEKIQRMKKKYIIELGLSFYYIMKCYNAYENDLISFSKLAELFLTDSNHCKQILNDFNLNVKHN